MDEYVCDIFMGGKQTLAIYNVCEDSLLASPLIIDLVVLTELFQRITYQTTTSKKISTFNLDDNQEWKSFHPVLGVLAYLLKAPLVKPGTQVVNALGKQRQCLENIIRMCVGLQPQSEIQIEHKI